MRLVAVSVVKNEADIIEAFVRHTSAWVDHHLIFDHDSTDGTRSILAALKSEGLPISLFTDENLGNLQQIRSNHLMRLAATVHAADWVLTLDADEILCGPNRRDLESILSELNPTEAAKLPLLNYYLTREDPVSVTNPILRQHYCQTAPSQTVKIIVPAQLAGDPQIAPGKGNHALYREGVELSAQPLPPDYCLAHLALRSPEHQIMRVVLAELQKLSRGKQHAGLDEHYRLGFQLLSETPALFFASLYQPVAGLQLRPIQYRGEPLKYHQSGQNWNRLAQALLPFAEKLATSHGHLLDASSSLKNDDNKPGNDIRELKDLDQRSLDEASMTSPFDGFIAESGWGPIEGPVPEAYLPPFHWAYAPATRLKIHAAAAGAALLTAEALTYSNNQSIEIELNGTPVHRHCFSRLNQKERLVVALNLGVGENQLTLRFNQSLNSSHDPRQLAVIFLSLRIKSTSTSL